VITVKNNLQDMCDVYMSDVCSVSINTIYTFQYLDAILYDFP